MWTKTSIKSKESLTMQISATAVSNWFQLLIFLSLSGWLPSSCALFSLPPAFCYPFPSFCLAFPFWSPTPPPKVGLCLRGGRCWGEMLFAYILAKERHFSWYGWQQGEKNGYPYRWMVLGRAALWLVPSPGLHLSSASGLVHDRSWKSLLWLYT